MNEFRLRVTAETQDAERRLRTVDDTANQASRARTIKVDADTQAVDSKLNNLSARFKEAEKGFSFKQVSGILDINKNIDELGKNVTTVANNIKTFYSYASKLPEVGEKIKAPVEAANTIKKVAVAAKEVNDIAGDNGRILKESYNIATKATETLLDRTAKLGMAFFGIKEAVGLVQAAFSGMFNETIGREIQFRETLLKTQTALASTSKVFNNGKEITDPYEKIVALTGTISDHVDSIRKRSIALAGVTSNDVIEVFGIVAQQIGQVGGGLKEAEDLAISFSAALGTFGLPLYQARQEIGSILRGDITQDSYLAKSLGITNQDIAKAKTQVGGVVKFLEDRLQAAVAGQRIAALGFKGVFFNIKDIYELVAQKFGAGLLDPVLGGLTKVFDFLYKIKDQLFGISGDKGLKGLGLFGVAGKGIGSLLATNTGVLTGGSQLLKTAENSAAPFLEKTTKGLDLFFAQVQSKVAQIVAPVRTIFEQIGQSLAVVLTSLVKLAASFALFELTKFQALVSVFAGLTPVITAAASALSKLLEGNANFLNAPIVQTVAQLKVEFDLLGKIGVFNLVKIGLGAQALIANWTMLKNVVASLPGRVASVAQTIQAYVAGLVRALARLAGAVLTVAETFTVSNAAIRAQITAMKAQVAVFENFNAKTGGLKAKLDELADTLKNKVGGAIKAVMASSVQLLLIEVALTLIVDAFARASREAEEASDFNKANLALDNLAKKYRTVTEASSAAQRAEKAYQQALADQQYNKARADIAKLRKEMNDLKYSMEHEWDDPLTQEQRRKEFMNRQLQVIQLMKYMRKYEAAQDADDLKSNITLVAQTRANIEKEIKDLRLQHENEIFQQRQALAQKEVNIFRASGDLRIYQMEQANKKLLEGEENNSRATLESLNSYLSTRERGELEIEASKKSVQIEVNNMEHAITNYRLEMEKKIAEIRKRANENDQKTTEYRRQVERQIAAGAGGGAAEFGLTGRTHMSDPNWAHAHFQTTTGTLEDVIKDVIPIVKALTDKGIPVELSNGVRIQAGKNDAYYTNVLQRAARLHGHSGDGRSVDFNVPKGTKVPVELSNVRGPQGNLGVSGVLPGTGKTVVGHLTRDSKAGQAAPVIPPTLRSTTDIGNGGREASEYATAVRNVTSAMERLRLLQAALTDAKTKEAFDAIATAAFNPVGLEQYRDQLYETQLTFKALGEASEKAFDPERAKLEVDANVKILASNRELQQIINAVQTTDSKLLNDKKKLELIEKIKEQHTRYVNSLRTELSLQTSVLAAKRANDTLQRLKTETTDINKELEVIKLQRRLELEGFSTEQIAAEVEKLRIRREIADRQKELNAALIEEERLRDRLLAQLPAATDKDRKELQQRLQEALAQIEVLKKQLSKLPEAGDARSRAADAKAKGSTPDALADLFSRWKRELNDIRSMLASLAQTIQSELATAMSTAVTGVLDGTSTIGEAFGQMFRNIAKSFIDMAMQMIAKALVMKALGILFPGLFPAEVATPAPVLTAATGAAFSNGIVPYATGGIVSSPTLFRFAEGGAMRTGLMGEAGPEGILPLRRGSNGDLGVQAFGTGGGAINVTVNVDASGSKVEGETQQAAQLGRVISAAVQSELVKQKRPGGLLA